MQYQLLISIFTILGAPTKPKVALVSAQSHSLSLAIDTVASSLGYAENPSPILWCTVSHKPLFGDILETILPAKNMEHFQVRHLQCGKHYDISSVCVNAHGESKASDVLRDIRTLGQKPGNIQRNCSYLGGRCGLVVITLAWQPTRRGKNFHLSDSSFGENL